MRRWFLSYHSPDRALAGRLKATPEQKDTGEHLDHVTFDKALPADAGTQGAGSSLSNFMLFKKLLSV